MDINQTNGQSYKYNIKQKFYGYIFIDKVVLCFKVYFHIWPPVNELILLVNIPLLYKRLVE
jgi:hypothetical protein